MSKKLLLTAGIAILLALVPVLLIRQASGVTITKETVRTAVIEKAIRASFCSTDPSTKACRELDHDVLAVFGNIRLYPIGFNNLNGITLTIIAINGEIYRSTGFSTVEIADRCLPAPRIQSDTQKTARETREIKKCHTREEGTAVNVKDESADESQAISYALESDMNGLVQNAEIIFADGTLLKMKHLEKTAENIVWLPTQKH